MRLDTSIINYYLSNGHIDGYKTHWIYQAIVPGTIQLDCPEPHKIARLRSVLALAKEELEHFTPLNIQLWESLYGHYHGIEDNVCIHLMVGAPEPYDAMVRQSPTGEFCIFFDLNRISEYNDEDDDALLFTFKNLITHEVAHLENRKRFKAPLPSDHWQKHLAFLALDEGIAHFLSVRENVTDIDWNSEKLLQHKANAYKAFRKEAQLQSDLSLNERLEKANSGSFWDKYGAIAGMFAISDFIIKEKRPLSDLLNLDEDTLYEKILNAPL